MSSLFYHGHRDWCSDVIDHASHTLQDSLQPLAQALPHSPVSRSCNVCVNSFISSLQVVDEIVAAVKRVITATLTFLQRLSDMQVNFELLRYQNLQLGSSKMQN